MNDMNDVSPVDHWVLGLFGKIAGMVMEFTYGGFPVKGRTYHRSYGLRLAYPV